MQKLLILGADGVVGANLALSLSDRFSVVAASHDQGCAIAGVGSTHCDLRDAPGLDALVRSESPDWTIFCGKLSTPSWDVGDTDVDLFASEPESALAVARAVTACGGQLTAISTDAVFEGPAMFHAEDSPATATSPFAQFAMQMEQNLASTDALVVRTLAFGWSPSPGAGHFADDIHQRLQEGGAMRGDARRHATPILVADLAESLLAAHERSLRGVLHIAGAERTNPRRFSAEVAAAFGFTGMLWLREDDTPDSAAAPSRETSLLARNAQRALEMPAPGLREGLARWALQAESGYLQRLQSSRATGALAAA